MSSSDAPPAERQQLFVCVAWVTGHFRRRRRGRTETIKRRPRNGKGSAGSRGGAGRLCSSRSPGERHQRDGGPRVPSVSTLRCLHSHLRLERDSCVHYGRSAEMSPGCCLQHAGQGGSCCASRAGDRRFGEMSQLESEAGRKGADAVSPPLFCSPGRQLLRRGPPRGEGDLLYLAPRLT